MNYLYIICYITLNVLTDIKTKLLFLYVLLSFVTTLYHLFRSLHSFLLDCCQHLLTNFGNGFRQEVPNGDAFDSILQGCEATAPNPELQSMSWYESVMWTTGDENQRKITIHFVKHYEMLQRPENTLLMIEGKMKL